MAPGPTPGPTHLLRPAGMCDKTHIDLTHTPHKQVGCRRRNPRGNRDREVLCCEKKNGGKEEIRLHHTKKTGRGYGRNPPIALDARPTGLQDGGEGIPEPRPTQQIRVRRKRLLQRLILAPKLVCGVCGFLGCVFSPRRA